MIVELQPGADPNPVLEIVLKRTAWARCVALEGRTWIVCADSTPHEFRDLPEVAQVFHSRLPHPLASSEFKPSKTEVNVAGRTVGCGPPVVIAGPCSVESREQLMETATFVARNGADLLRGGAFKPRTSPYSFQGLGKLGLELLAEARTATGLPIVTEALTPAHVELVAGYADIVQVGARNMQNFQLLREVGRAGKPVLLKRAPWATLSMWLQAAEYVLAEGNFALILCERGICASEASAGRHLDIAAVRQLRQMTHLPIIVDPSHGTGDRDLVIPMAIASLIAGADGIMVEVHPHPDQALSDGPQSLNLTGFRRLMDLVERIRLSEPIYAPLIAGGAD